MSRQSPPASPAGSPAKANLVHNGPRFPPGGLAGPQRRGGGDAEKKWLRASDGAGPLSRERPQNSHFRASTVCVLGHLDAT